MSIAKTYSAQLIGLDPEIIRLEVDLSNGLHAFNVIGLGDRSVDESKDRVSAAIKNSGFVSPKQKNQKVIVSLAPADIKKEGPSFDIAIAISYLLASFQIRADLEGKLLFGELSLEGEVRRVNGILPVLCRAHSKGFSEVFIPEANSEEASLAQGITIYPIRNLKDLTDHLEGKKKILPLEPRDQIDDTPCESDHFDMKYIRGNESAKRGLEIAAAGAHNLLMMGPPGTGKTLLAKSFSSILPSLTYDQSIEVTGIHSAARVLGRRLVTRPPFRAPHHTASYPAVIGGGTFPRPGEITLAHRGVLFLDEFPEFDRSVIEALREPLEDRKITIARAKASITFPAQCIFIASMNPCPCGKGKDKGCTCTTHSIESYKRKLSGPILDRIDIWLSVDKVDHDALAEKTNRAEDSKSIRDKICRARDHQRHRFESAGIKKTFNSEMDVQDINELIKMVDETRNMLSVWSKNLDLSGRSFHRLLKVSRTIADLADCEIVRDEHILEALQYRKRPIL